MVIEGRNMWWVLEPKLHANSVVEMFQQIYLLTVELKSQLRAGEEGGWEDGGEKEKNEKWSQKGGSLVFYIERVEFINIQSRILELGQ